MRYNFKNKNVIITGGSGGIGSAVAEGFLKHGARVVIISRSKKKLEKTKKELLNTSDKVEILSADVSNIKDISKIKSFIKKRLDNGVDVLVNAAAIYGPIGKFEELSPRKYVQAFEVNVFGTMYMCMVVIPQMKKKKRGKIINFSGGGDGPLPRFTAYSSTKGAILRFTESLAVELKDFNITVNTIAPGAVNTKMLEEVLRAGPDKVGNEFFERALKQKKEGGVSPDLTMKLILFLSSNKYSGNLTGKMFSSVWDDWPNFSKHLKEIASSDVYNMRRIKPKDRGYDW